MLEVKATLQFAIRIQNDMTEAKLCVSGRDVFFVFVVIENHAPDFLSLQDLSIEGKWCLRKIEGIGQY